MTKNKKGFTIIEVVLVLAIAGLIFLMVFIALPALQRSQRNTQREDDLSRFLTAANDYQTNNSGKTPFGKTTDAHAGVDNKFVKRYIDNKCETKDNSKGTYENCESEFTDPDGTIYAMKWYKKANKDSEDVIGDIKWSGSDHQVRVYTNATCGDEGKVVKGSGDRQYAMLYILEGDSITCNDNH